MTTENWNDPPCEHPQTTIARLIAERIESLTARAEKAEAERDELRDEVVRLSDRIITTEGERDDHRAMLLVVGKERDAAAAARDEAISAHRIELDRRMKAEAERDAIAAAAYGALCECYNMWQDECWIGRPEGAHIDVVGFFRPYYDAKLKNCGELANKFNPSPDARAALDRLIADRVAEAVKVKPLAWEERDKGHWAAESIIGMFYTTKYAGMPEPFVLERPGYGSPTEGFTTLATAQAAAQADYEARIRAALAADGEA